MQEDATLVKNFVKSVMILLLLLGSSSFAQSNPQLINPNDIAEQQRLQLAQRYRQSNQYQYVVQIVEPMYQQRPGDARFYQLLLDAYLKLQQYEKAEQLVRRQLSIYPDNPSYKIDEGNVLFRAGKEAEAEAIWEQVLQSSKKSMPIYSDLINTYISNRLYAKAEKLYVRAIKEFPQNSFFLRSLADFYRQQFRFVKALNTYLDYVEKAPQNYEHVARTILSMELESNQLDSLDAVFKKRLSQSKLPQIHLVAAQFYQKHKQYDRAFDILNQLESGDSQGRYLEEFARTAQSDSAFTLALNAYQKIIEQFPDSPHALNAYLGAAKCNLALAEQTNDQQYARRAIEMIRHVQDKYAGNINLARMAMLEGDIYRDYFFDLDKAIEVYRSVGNVYAKNRRIWEEAQINIAKCYLMKGNLPKAASAVETIAGGALWGEVLLLRARVAMYEGDYEKAGELLSQLIQVEGVNGEHTNDALAMQTLLVNQTMAPEALQHYLRADWLKLQNKRNEAISELQKALEINPPAHFRVVVLLEAARLHRSLGNFPDALEMCNAIISDAQLKLYADEALYLMATILDKDLNDIAQAARLYDRLLVDFPESGYVSAARERLRFLRQKYPDLVQ